MHDVIIVGGSFSGLAAALQLARARKDILVVDAGSARNRFAEAAHGFLGQDGRPPHEIRADARAQLLAYPTVRFVNGEVVEAAKVDGVFHVTIRGEEPGHATARRIILATGVKDELPAIPGLEERWGRTVLHCPYCHGYEVAGKVIGVLGGDEKAVHRAAFLADWGQVVLFQEGGNEPAAEEWALLRRRGVTVERTRVRRIVGDAPDLAGVLLEDGRTAAIDALFVPPRTKQASALGAMLGCAFDTGPAGPYLRLDDRKETTVAGVYAAGDAAAAMHNGTLAAAAGVLAAMHVHQSLVFE